MRKYDANKSRERAQDIKDNSFGKGQYPIWRQKHKKERAMLTTQREEKD